MKQIDDMMQCNATKKYNEETWQKYLGNGSQLNKNRKKNQLNPLKPFIPEGINKNIGMGLSKNICNQSKNNIQTITMTMEDALNK